MTRALLLTMTLALLAACGAPPAPQLGDPCASIADCAGTDGLSCRESTCQAIACSRSAACPIGAACIRGVCGVAECLEDDDCAESSCFEGECVRDLCDLTEQCPSGQVCRGVPPLCRTPPDVCVRDGECPVGQVCRIATGECVDGCVGDDSCEDRAYCDGRICRPLCAEDAECSALEACSEGRCAPRSSCSGAPDCPEDAPTRDPVSCQCFECRDDADCDEARGEACVGSSCVYCPARATEAASCEAQGFVFDRGCCLGCLEDADCDGALGEACEAGRCLDPIRQTCLTDSDCPTGLLCDGDRCVEDTSTSPCALQSDCPDGRACTSDGVCRTAADVCDPPCPAPGRCVASPGDALGACVGCTEHCAQAGCPDGLRCVVPEGQAEGYCADVDFFGLCG
jgi:hypothetical protein